MAVRFVPRSRDDQVLFWLRMRCAGWSAERIARREGVKNSGSIITATQFVRDADLAESGEPAAKVMAAYEWKPKTGRAT